MSAGAGRPTVAVLAVDGGNSKTDVALVGRGRPPAGGRCAARRPRTRRSGWTPGADRLVELGATPPGRAAGLGSATRPPATSASYALAGADTPADVRRLTRRLRARRPGRRRRSSSTTPFAPVRAGSERGWGVGVICGAGRQRGRDRARTGGRPGSPRSATISGDWGGGGDVGMRGARAPRSGRATAAARGRCLERLVPAPLRLRAGRST